MMSCVEIYRASMSQYAEVHQIVHQYYDEIDVLVRDSDDELKKYFEEGYGIWLAQTETQQIIGCVLLRALDGLEKSCEIKRLYVRHEYRGQAIADKLLDALEQYAEKHGYQAAYLDSKSDLYAALRIYERRGYHECERYNDNPQATIFMRRCLRALSKS